MWVDGSRASSDDEEYTLTGVARVSLLCSLGLPFGICGYYLGVMPLMVEGVISKELAHVCAALVFAGIPMVAIVTGVTAFFQKENPKWVPAVSVGCGCLPLVLLTLLLIAVAMTGGR